MRIFEAPARDFEGQGKSFVRVGMEVSRANDSSAQSATGDFAKGPNPFPTSPDVWAACLRPPSSEEIKVLHCELGYLCWPGGVWRPDFSARLARIA